MNYREKSLLALYLKDYLKKYYKEFGNEKKLFKCPVCNENETAQLLHNHILCYNPPCKVKLDIFDSVREIQSNLTSLSDDDIKDYLKRSLNIKIEDNTNELLKRYSDLYFSIFPLKAQGQGKLSKEPLDGYLFKEKDQYNSNLWQDWLERGLGLGLKLGTSSKVMAIDIDSDETWEKVKHLLNETMIQTTKRGRHFLYKYDEDFASINHKNFRNQGYEMELRNNNAYIVIAPTSVEGETREWNNSPITEIPNELKKFLLELCKDNIKKEEPEDEIQRVITSGQMDVVDLAGRRNDTFVKLAGIFRKKLNLDQTEYILNIISNTLIDKPIEPRELRAILGQIKKYNTYDKKELSKILLERFDIIKEGTAFQVAKSLNYEQKDVEEVLNYLEKEGKIVSIGNNRFRRLEQVEWTTGYEDFSIPIDFEVPYFSEFARFDIGNMILIGGKTGVGKTHITANFIKKFAEQQNIKSIDLITTEAGSKIGKVLEVLKVPQVFVHRPKTLYKHPTQIELREDRITIVDWLKPVGGDFAQMDDTMEHFHNQMKKHKGFLIIFVQIRDDDKGTFFAKDQISNYMALSAKFMYTGTDNLNPYFQTTKIRDSRVGAQYMAIPLSFDPVTKLLERKK